LENPVLPNLPPLSPEILLPLLNSSASSTLSYIPSSPLQLPPLSFVINLQRLFWFNLKFLNKNLERFEQEKFGLFAAAACFPLSSRKSVEISLRNLAFAKVLQGKGAFWGMKPNDK
jgi:hypothetical protein